MFLKTEKKQKQKQNYNFSEIFSCQAFLLIQHCVESDMQEKNRLKNYWRTTKEVKFIEFHEKNVPF